ncbi:hypothetical protein [Microbacterium oleivorans]|uniref:Nucleoside phosphorylase n=1 Tax=Microbacterium oleivorans TaxID=273677 RepID=A0A031FV57_9MICO|nr:hypothetical protein [Microbacterium oleivorans]AZS43005.1 hypothetical protein BWL13_00547 [Microbacterium oleivorans]EZP28157.1 Nucleoside phosphorylase [Microbacterium oleivorans]
MDHDHADAEDKTIEGAPAGGWSTEGSPDGAASGAVTNEQKEAEDAADRGRGEGAPMPEPASDPFVESAEIQQGLDPDVLTDEQADRRGE